MKIKTLTCLLLTVLTSAECLSLGCQAAEVMKEVTLQSLLKEMTDRDSLARLPVNSYSCRQVSSWDRQQTDPKNGQAWFANHDYEQFMRTEENEGRKEWVIMDDKGPGAVTRFWTPLFDNRDKQIIRFYFDGASSPTITVPLNEFLSGRDFVKPPLAFISWNEMDLLEQRKPEIKRNRGIGGDLYLPIPFAKGCKITLDSLPFYYVINYRIYDAGTPVKTFSMADYKAASAAVEQAGSAMLTDAPEDPKLKTDGKQATLKPGEELAIALPPGAAAVRDLKVELSPDASGQDLRSVVLTASFDEEATIWCPLSEFFGAGVRTNAPVRDWCRMVSANGTLESRWVMPYRKSAAVGLKNTGKVPVTVELSVGTGQWKWDDRSMYFHATWRGKNGIETRPMSDWNYIEIQGKGLYVGDVLTVFNPVEGWYGEGDERVYIDGESFPSHMGTGTEDYYGYAWGMADYFSSPFISMPKRDSVGQADWRGYTTTSRIRILDAIPFKTGLKFDMEIWHARDTKMDYAAGTFWYGCLGATCNSKSLGLELNPSAIPLHQPQIMPGGSISKEEDKRP